MFVLDKQAIKFYYKVRHRRGHGIHSPFVYNLIVNVIENKLSFYAFRDIQDYIQQETSKKYKPKKINKLNFKLINHFQAKNILEIGSAKGINSLYATAPSSQIRYTCVETKEGSRKAASSLLHHWKRDVLIVDSLPKTDQIFDCILVDMKTIGKHQEVLSEYLFSHVNENSVVILNNIRTNTNVYSLVQQIRKDEHVHISLDLYKASIFFFNKKYYKRNYLLSF
ncbi:MAG: putative O-methyltransferase YrrM [Bacteroidetes bacterium]|nr:putative O-methyltransferase YrrM [Bacteroidota bacterium]